jgi:hypothetical protein
VSALPALSTAFELNTKLSDAEIAAVIAPNISKANDLARVA